jgi:hypothetical protein
MPGSRRACAVSVVAMPVAEIYAETRVSGACQFGGLWGAALAELPRRASWGGGGTGLTLGSRRWCLVGSSFLGRRIDHEKKALFCGGELGDVVFGMGSTDMLLHGAISLFLEWRKGGLEAGDKAKACEA